MMNLQNLAQGVVTDWQSTRVGRNLNERGEPVIEFEDLAPVIENALLKVKEEQYVTVTFLERRIVDLEAALRDAVAATWEAAHEMALKAIDDCTSHAGPVSPQVFRALIEQGLEQLQHTFFSSIKGYLRMAMDFSFKQRKALAKAREVGDG